MFSCADKGFFNLSYKVFSYFFCPHIKKKTKSRLYLLFFYKFSCGCLILEILVNKKNIFQSNKNLAWFLKNYFPFILGGKNFSEIVKNLEISYYLPIISNLIFKLLIAIYFVLNLFFNFIP